MDINLVSPVKILISAPCHGDYVRMVLTIYGVLALLVVEKQQT